MSFLNALAAVIPDEINLSELNVSLEEDAIKRAELDTYAVINLYYTNTVTNARYTLACNAANEKIVFNSFKPSIATYAPGALVSDLILQVDFMPIVTYTKSSMIDYFSINDINETTGDYAGTDTCVAWSRTNALQIETAPCAP